MMKYRFIIIFLFIIGLFCYNKYPETSIPLSISQKYTYQILMLPLDSRPACTKFVVELGKIANINIITPPKELLDYYDTPSNTQKLRSWVRENIHKSDAAILSIDSLIHGGLLASRHALGIEKDTIETLSLLETIHKENPTTPIYAFNILPRMWLADSPENQKYQKDVLEYSKLKDQIYTFENPLDIKKIIEIESTLPPDLLDKYHKLYQKNIDLNKKLIHLSQKGIITKLIIGQDDGQIFGIPNISKNLLLHYLDGEHLSTNQVILTRGADEVALNLLGTISNQLLKFHPKINVQYSDTEAPSIIMPYMPNSVATTVKEKIEILGGIVTSKPEDADFILFVYIGTEKNQNDRFLINKKIQALLKENYKVALVDLSEDFMQEKTIFPMLLANGTPMQQFIAYAGWNTASNSIGTALTQASIFTSMLKRSTTTNDILKLYQNNITFLISRYIEDWYYLKNVIDLINTSLKKQKINPYQLNVHHSMANHMLTQELNHKVFSFTQYRSYQEPIRILTPDGIKQIKLRNLQFATSYPWPRTFEIDLNTQIDLVEIKKP